MHVQLDRNDDLRATLTVRISKDDYGKKYKSALEEYRKKGQFKGFRKGKTPLGYIRKIYGKAVLADAVNEVLQKAVMDYLTDHEVDFLGQPLPAEDQEPLDFDPRDLREYEFKFDLGMAPEFELQGLDGKVQRYDVTIPDDMVDEEWLRLRKRLGSMEPVEDVEEDDILYIIAREMEGASVKEGGWESSFAIRLNDLADEETRKKILEQQGGKFEFTLDALEKDRDAAFVKKHHLGLEDQPDRIVSNKFQGEVEQIQRLKPADPDREFLDKVFGEGQVESAEGGMDKIRRDIKSHYDRQADAILYKDMQKHLMKVNDLPLPEAFLQRWLDTQPREEGEEPSEQDRKDFLEDLRWQLIKERIVKQNQLEVTEDEIRESAMRRIYSYMGAYADPERIQMLAQTVLQNQDQVNSISREIMAGKVFEVLRKMFTIENVEIGKDAFEEKAEEILG